MAVQSPSSRHEESGAAQTHANYVLHAPILKGALIANVLANRVTTYTFSNIFKTEPIKNRLPLDREANFYE
jgi:hypothetical protein